MDRRGEARLLQAAAAAQSGVAIEVRWDSSGASQGPSWHVVWDDGPTIEAMKARIERLAGNFHALKADDLVYVRTIQPISVAVAMVRNVRLGQPPLGEWKTTWDLEHQLRETSHPERGTPGDISRAQELVRESGGLTENMASLLERNRLQAALPETRQGNVIPLRRPRP